MHVEDAAATPGRLDGLLAFLKRRFWFLLPLALISAPLTSWVVEPPSALDLAHSSAIAASGLVNEWAEGNAMVVIRHGERCDRSHNQCLGDPEGITVNGAAVAAKAGQALQALGLENTDVLSSPLVRTVQTSRALTGRDVPTVALLRECQKPPLEDLLALKQPGRNLVIVTHSGCIEQYEQQLGVGGTPEGGYVSAFFLSDVGAESATVLGYLDASGWRTLLAEATD